MNPIKANLLGRLELAMLNLNEERVDITRFSIPDGSYHHVSEVLLRNGVLYIKTLYNKSMRRSLINANMAGEDVLENVTVLVEAISKGFVTFKEIKE